MTFGLSAAAIGGIAAGAGAIGGALISSNASKSAANTQAQSARDASGVQREIFDQQVALQEPFRQTGVAANQRLNFLLGLPQPAAPAAAASTQLVQGPDGVFAPRAEMPAAGGSPVDTVTQLFRQHLGRDPEPQALAYYQNMLNTAGLDSVRNDIAGSQEANTPHAPYQPQQQPPQPQAQQAPAAQADQPPPTPGGFGEAGSLSRNFGAAEYAADGAPKYGDFTAQPNLPTFNQADPQYQALQSFQDVPKFTAADMVVDPGYQFRLTEGQKALERSASARGGLLSGKAAKDTLAYSQGLASDEFGKSFDRYQVNRGNSLQTFLTNRDTSNLNWQNASTDYTNRFNRAQVTRTNAVNDWKDQLAVYQANRANANADYESAYNRFQTNRANVINPLLSLSGAGQVATGQVNSAAQNYGNTSAALITGAGNARAAGQVGAANALNGGITQGISLYQQNQLLNRYPFPYDTGAGMSPPNPYYGG